MEAGQVLRWDSNSREVGIGEELNYYFRITWDAFRRVCYTKRILVRLRNAFDCDSDLHSAAAHVSFWTHIDASCLRRFKRSWSAFKARFGSLKKLFFKKYMGLPVISGYFHSFRLTTDEKDLAPLSLSDQLQRDSRELFKEFFVSKCDWQIHVDHLSVFLLSKDCLSFFSDLSKSESLLISWIQWIVFFNHWIIARFRWKRSKVFILFCANGSKMKESRRLFSRCSSASLRRSSIDPSSSWSLSILPQITSIFVSSSSRSVRLFSGMIRGDQQSSRLSMKGSLCQSIDLRLSSGIGEMSRWIRSFATNSVSPPTNEEIADLYLWIRREISSIERFSSSLDPSSRDSTTDLVGKREFQEFIRLSLNLLDKGDRSFHLESDVCLSNHQQAEKNDRSTRHHWIAK